MILRETELCLTPALDDLVVLHPGTLPGPATTYRIEDGPLPGDTWFVHLADAGTPGCLDWAATVRSEDIHTITRIIPTGVMTWEYEHEAAEDPSTDH